LEIIIVLILRQKNNETGIIGAVKLVKAIKHPIYYQTNFSLLLKKYYHGDYVKTKRAL